MLTQTETQSRYYELATIEFVFIHLNIKKLNSREIEEINVLTKSIFLAQSSSALRNWFLAQSIRSLIMLSFQDKIQANASIFIAILHNFSLHIKSTNLFWREREETKKEKGMIVVVMKEERRGVEGERRDEERRERAKREKKKLATFYLILNLNMKKKLAFLLETGKPSMLIYSCLFF